MSTPTEPREYVLTIRDTGDTESRARRLRSALKYLLRVFGLRCLRIEPKEAS